MPRPKNKLELLDQGERGYNDLIEFIQNLSEPKKKQSFPIGTLNRNIRDVLGHLHHWHLLFLSWYEVGMNGGKPEMPAPGYTWKTTSELNVTIQEEYETMDLNEVIVSFAESYLSMKKIIEHHSDHELFTKKLYKWTGSTSLGSYLTSATSSHYAWALKLIKKSIR